MKNPVPLKTCEDLCDKLATMVQKSADYDCKLSCKDAMVSIRIVFGTSFPVTMLCHPLYSCTVCCGCTNGQNDRCLRKQIYFDEETI